MIKRFMNYSVRCDLCSHYKSRITEDFNYDTNDFMKEMRKERWIIDDDKTICPECKEKLERIKLL